MPVDLKNAICPTCGFMPGSGEDASHVCSEHMVKKADIILAIRGCQWLQPYQKRLVLESLDLPAN